MRGGGILAALALALAVAMTASACAADGAPPGVSVAQEMPDGDDPQGWDAAGQDLEVEPYYGTVYLSAGDAWRPDDVSRRGYARHLWSADGFVYLGTRKQDGPTPLRIVILDGPPAGEGDEVWEQISEVSVESDGSLDVYDGGADEPLATVDVPSGDIRLRVSWAGVADGPDGSGPPDGSDERVLAQVWAQEAAPPRVPREAAGWSDRFGRAEN
jgi:hypothetical protein